MAVYGVTTRELAKDLGISAATVSRMARGHAMDAATLVRVIQWLMTEIR
jgi:transcriptional regulator with XRE-family HTH domain